MIFKTCRGRNCNRARTCFRYVRYAANYQYVGDFDTQLDGCGRYLESRSARTIAADKRKQNKILEIINAPD